MFDIVLGIFLFLSPIFLLPRPIGNLNALQFYQYDVLGYLGYNYLQLQFFQYGIVLLFAVALSCFPKRSFKDKYTTVFFSSLCLVIFFHPVSIKLFLSIFLAFVLYYITINYTNNYKRFFWIIFSVSALNTIFAILQKFGIFLIYQPTGRCDGLMQLSTHLGVYQLMALPISYAINPILVIVPCISIFLSKSITSEILTILWLGIAFKKQIAKQGFPFFVFLICLFILFIIGNKYLIIQKFQIRLLAWIPTINMIKHKFFLGYGIKSFKLMSPIGLFENPCSIYLELIYYFGAITVIPALLFFKNLFKNSNPFILSSVVLALLAGIEKSFLDYPRLAGTFIVLCAFLVISKGEQNGKCST